MLSPFGGGLRGRTQQQQQQQQQQQLTEAYNLLHHQNLSWGLRVDLENLCILPLYPPPKGEILNSQE